MTSAAREPLNSESRSLMEHVTPLVLSEKAKIKCFCTILKVIFYSVHLLVTLKCLQTEQSNANLLCVESTVDKVELKAGRKKRLLKKP